MGLAADFTARLDARGNRNLKTVKSGFKKVWDKNLKKYVWVKAK